MPESASPPTASQPTDIVQLTPMLEQYFHMKGKAGEALLLFRMGDFYELFYEDAVVAAKALDIALTSRQKFQDEPIPMCGVPAHSADGYIDRLIQQGFKVAICEQVEDPAQAKGLVKAGYYSYHHARALSPAAVLLHRRSTTFLPAWHAHPAGQGSPMSIFQQGPLP